MGNMLDIELFNDLKAVCMQAKNELCAAYSYFEKISDYNGICILYREIVAFDELFISLDFENPSMHDYDIKVPNIYEWGFYNISLYKEARSKADAAVLNAIEQKKMKTNQKIYMNNGSFYGYYCYNIYNKCLGWINYSLKKYPIKTTFNQLIINHFESAMQYFMRYEG